MNHRTLLRRTGILCLHCLRNIAYYRAWNAAPSLRKKEQFWRSVNGNFIDMAFLEWCKLFGDSTAKHHWSKCITDQKSFKQGLLASTNLTAKEFDVYRIEVRKYRDKFVAHLDELNDMQIPSLQPALDSVRYLYQYLVDVENDVDAYPDAPQDANNYYQEKLTQGRSAHRG